MKRLLLISRCPPYPLHLGDRLIVWHLARELARRDYTIDLLAFVDWPEDRDEIDKYRAYFHEVTLVDDPRRTLLSYLKRRMWPGARFPTRSAESWSPTMWQAIAQHIDGNRYDMVHLFGGVQVYEFHHALRGLPAIITPYESFSLYLARLITNAKGRTFFDLVAWQAQLQLSIARRFESFMFTPYDRTVVVSQQDKDALLRINPALEINVIPNGVDLDYFQMQPVHAEQATLLFTGNYEYAPNVDAALRLARVILPQVQAEIPATKLWLVGNAPTREIQSLASESVMVTGRVPDVRPYLATATAFVSPLRLGAGIKNKVLEALAMGCPLVATPLSVDGIAVTPGQDALIADDGAVVEHIVRLLKDTALQRQLAANGRKLIEAQHTWGRVVDLYEALYEEVGGVRD